MALLIAFELFSMLFAMDILSSVRAFVGGEGRWSKAQKDAIQSLHRYALSNDRKDYFDFQQHLKVNFGDRTARIELQKEHPNMDKVRAGFIEGGIHPHDIDGLVRLFRRFHQFYYLDHAIQIWSDADSHLSELVKAAEELDVAIQSRPRSEKEVLAALDKVDALNSELTKLENEFSAVLAEGSRWMEGLLKYLLIFAVLVVESTGLYLTFAFSRHFGRTIREMSAVAKNVGTRDFSKTVPVHSSDELGQLAVTINKMIQDLKSSLGQKQKAENENQTKSLFLANMSHEIRTPLGVILGLTEALKQGGLSAEDQKHFIETIERTGLDLRQIINDILDLSKVEAGYLEIEKQNFSLSQFISELHDALSARAIKNENKLIFACDQSDVQIPDLISADRGRLRQILINVIGNALKFTKNGMVTVRFWIANQTLYFRVTDTGIGMTANQAEQLFQAFAQVDASPNRKFGGTGLGLFLSRQLAKLMGGNVILEKSEPSLGSSFLISVEIEVGKEIIEPLASSSDEKSSIFSDKKVLIVDDSADNQILLQFFMKKWGLNYDWATNGQEAIDKATSNQYDIVLMDIQMPLKDGYEATQELRQKGFEKPIVALTAHAMKAETERCLLAGCNRYLTKPIDFRSLQEVLRELI